MSMQYDEIDNLTKIHNELYLKNNYQEYLNNNKDANFIMIDFKKFKHINDTYGHNIGDKYLISFAKILNDTFTNSIVARLHGDEYAIITNCSPVEIEKRLDICSEKINELVKKEEIPESFGFNAGIVKADSNIELSSLKADYMMYYAKNNNNNFQFFSERIWKEKLYQDEFTKNIHDDLSTDRLTYYGREISNDNGDSMLEISTRDSQGNSVFSDKNYKFLRENSQLKKIDLYNLNYLLANYIESNNSKIIINIDYKSVLSKVNLLMELKNMIEAYNIEPSNIVLSINTEDITSNMYNIIIVMLNELKGIGFNICIDKYSSATPDIFIENIDVDYIKIDSKYWKKAMQNIKVAQMLSNKIRLFKSIGNIDTIINCIENEQEYGFIKNLTLNSKDVLLSGNYFSTEKQMERVKIN